MITVQLEFEQTSHIVFGSKNYTGPTTINITKFYNRNVYYGIRYSFT